ncbi:DNA repair protein RadA [Ammoniphilus sp. CFH 90114]|uniref:DNA repair protein RadA n=1 Tax=Ammoniphilus sp. CFH 90114 TaxID=2493665 RepID=UPI00100F03D7|nr:DNA repair protein RadA [Ammoniphilus sp. CFH 90114]RXT09047.1 DNA repair protein RadA [Ammoniphilus sp. CFH 90114]
MAKLKTKFVCQQCGYETPKWMGKCPGCESWNTLVEELEEQKKNTGHQHRSVSSKDNVALSIKEIQSEQEPRLDAGMAELNRVLGGGIVPGSLILVGGDPGIGKSTILLQMSHFLAQSKHKVLYISGEESTKQTKLRAERLGADSDELFVLSETDLERIEWQVGEIEPKVVVIDSIQTVYHPAVTSAPGSVSQVRECTSHLMRLGKSKDIAIVIVGHVTKQGDLAGPRLLEHMVDSVLYFEGERHNTYRILRSVKNRFGSTHEIGIFEMLEKGLQEVSNPSELFLSERSKAAGSAVVASMEGTRPVLVELQALVTPTSFPSPRRMATGVDYNRVALIMAVLEKRVGMLMQNQDAYVNVAGGIRLDEPAIDLAIAVSLASSFRDLATQPDDVIIGEVGLTGEVRGVSRMEQRVKEAAKLGFKRVIMPEKNLAGWQPPRGIELIPVRTVEEALREAIGR